MSRGLAVALGLLSLSACTAMPAQRSSAERIRLFASLPDWTGLWEPKSSADSDNLSGGPAAGKSGPPVELFRKPPYRPEWERDMKAHPSRAANTPIRLCRDIPFPWRLELPFMFQVLVTPEETLFLYENGDVRHIYTDGRAHPRSEDLWPTAAGDSIGHWDGDTLVIDTIEVQSVDRVGGFSGQAHFTERVHRRDRNVLEDDLTVDDPARLAHPWHVRVRWTRVLDQDRMLPWDCEENDRNPIVNGKMTIASPRP